jgi:phage terminase large subunit-like protein
MAWHNKNKTREAQGRGMGRKVGEKAQREKNYGNFGKSPRSTKGVNWKNETLPQIERVFLFIESLPVTKGILAGTKMKLLPLQKEWLTRIICPVRMDNTRLIRLAIRSEPRGNGKTGLAAALALCFLCGPLAEQRGAIYSASIDRDMAAIMYEEMEAIIYATPALAKCVVMRRGVKEIEVLEGHGLGSIYKALSADVRRGTGLAPSFWVYDELAQAKDRVLLDNLLTAMGKRKQAMGVVISTQAKDDNHVLSQMIDDAANDPTTDLELHAAPIDADIFDEEVWKACNEAWGIYLNIDDFRAKADRARRVPAFEPAFRNLHLNQRVDAQDEQRIVTAAVWKLGDRPIGELGERVCYAGLDLSGKHDLTALVLAFDRDQDGQFDILPFFWTPTEALEQRSHNEAALFRQWIREGWLIPVPGPVIEFAFVAQQLVQICRRYNVQAVGFDRWRIDELLHELGKVQERDGIELETAFEPFGQGYKDMSPAVEHFQELALAAKLRHGGHPVLTACVANAILSKPDDAGNMKFAKGKANEGSVVRIDGIVAAAMALGTMKRLQALDGGPSVYERRGLVDVEGLAT